MLNRPRCRQGNGLKAAMTRAVTGMLLLFWGFQMVPVWAVSINADTLGAGMNTLSRSADCTGENLSANRVVCRDTLTDIAQDYVAREIADGVVNTGLKLIGKVSGRLGMDSLSAAARTAPRALGVVGKLTTSWEFGTRLGSGISEHVVSPRIERRHQEQERREREKIKEQTDLLRSDRFVAGEYREILRERGAKEANAYLDEQTRIAREYAADSTDSYYEEMERMERARQQAEAMEDNPGGWDDDRPLTEPDPEIGASCDSPDIYPVDDPCDSVRTDLDNWADNLTSPEYLATFSCEKMWGDLHDVIDSFEACYHREYTDKPLLYRCSLEHLQWWRQSIADITRGSGCSP